MKKEGNRLVQIGCAKVGEINSRSTTRSTRTSCSRTCGSPLKQDTKVPSVSGIYWGAFVYENEIHDLYGITVTGINIDFKGTFYRTAVKHAFSVTTVKEDNPCLNK